MLWGEDKNLKIEKASSYLLVGGVKQTENMNRIFRMLFAGCSLAIYIFVLDVHLSSVLNF